MIVVTGGAGFIGSNLVRRLNQKGRKDILVVDDMQDGRKFRNISDCDIEDYLDKDDFLDLLEIEDLLTEVEVVFHQGACSVTTEWDGKYMMDNNYTCSKILFDACVLAEVPFIYASSGSVYGTGTSFAEMRENEQPVNVYGYSKMLFDHYVRRLLPDINSQVVGLRYFNVFGRGESHKGAMASVVYHFNEQLKQTGKVNLFKGSGGYSDGEQRRDFVYIDDVINVNLWFFENQGKSGIYNVGTGESRTFNDVAKTVIDINGNGEINYVEFPEQLIDSYQSFTEADITALRDAGFCPEFLPLEDSIKDYIDWLNS